MSVTGSTVLTVGLTTQFAAHTPSGAVVTTAVTWQSSNTQVVTVSASGLVTAVSPGSATVVVTPAASSGLAQASVSVTVEAVGGGVGPIPVGSCQFINVAGSYVLSQDLSSTKTTTNTSCLLVADVAQVQIDCRGHSLPGLSLSNVSTVTVSHCTVNAGALGSQMSAVSVQSGTNVQFIADTIATTGGNSGIFLKYGSNNQVLQSTLTGGYAGGPNELGTDDGISMADETGDLITGNTISGYFDTAVEGGAAISNTTIANNTFTNIGTAAIGSYWCTDWTGNVVQSNRVSTAPSLFLGTYSVMEPNCDGWTTPPVFSGNQFIGNVFRSPVGLITARMTVEINGTVSNNLLENNDFGSSDGPFLMPLSGFADGGGNICGPLNPALSNFVCTGGSRAVSGVRPALWARPPRSGTGHGGR